MLRKKQKLTDITHFVLLMFVEVQIHLASPPKVQKLFESSCAPPVTPAFLQLLVAHEFKENFDRSETQPFKRNSIPSTFLGIKQ
jgi:hypothetical protein